jgi:DNA polymerase III delta subunit
MAEVYLITGTDEPLIEERARKLTRQFAGDDADAFTLEIHKESDDKTPAEAIDGVIEGLLTPSLFGGMKTIWLQNFRAFSGAAKKADDETEYEDGGGLLKAAAGTLAKIISDRFPEDTNLVINGPGFDGRSRLVQACRRAGTVETLDKPKISDFKWRENVVRILEASAGNRQMTLPPDACEYLLEVIGVDTGRIGNELEKIYCYAGATPSLRDIQDVCTGTREAAYFALSNMLGDRDLNGAFATINQLLGNTKNPESAVIGLLRQASNHFRQLLEARLLLRVLNVSRRGELAPAVKSMSAADREHYGNYLLLTRVKSDWQMNRLAAQARKFTGPELVNAIGLLAEADKSNVSSTLSRRLILENLTFRIIAGHPQKNAGA